MISTSYDDKFIVEHFPAPEQLPEQVYTLETLQFPDTLNCAATLLDAQLQNGRADKAAIIGEQASWTYRELDERSSQIAHVLVDEMGLVPGNRVLLRSPNNPLLAACWLAVIKAGGIAVATMPLLRSRDLIPIIRKAEITIALCDVRLQEDLLDASEQNSSLQQIKYFNAEDLPGDQDLEATMAAKPLSFDSYPSRRDDVALIAFTSGTTGDPKGTMHYHSDVMAMCRCVVDGLIKADDSDIFIGSPPLAFTFGLGMQLAFPLYAGATTVLIENPAPLKLAAAVDEYGATVCATSPTAYRMILADRNKFDLGSLRKTVSAGEHLPLSTFEAWEKETGLKMINGLGTTEMIHIFIGASGDAVRLGSTGKALPGYEVRIVDENNVPLPPNKVGRLAVRGPTGCKYLADPRQMDYVLDGWNMTGDLCEIDDEGYVWYRGRTDDMIVSAGYNISPTEVEEALGLHDAVAECAVIGIPDEERGSLVKACVVLNGGFNAATELVGELQGFVKQAIAPYKYPRVIEFVETLPKTQTGKIQRKRLRDIQR